MKRSWAVALGAALWSCWAGSTSALEERGRFEARFPYVMTYDPQSCALWLGGRSKMAWKHTLFGQRLMNFQNNLPLSGLWMWEEKLHYGTTVPDRVLSTVQSEAARLGRVLPPNAWGEHRFVSGGVRVSETVFLYAMEPFEALLLHGKHQPPRFVARVDRVGRFTGVAYDAPAKEIIAVFTGPAGDWLYVFDLAYQKKREVDLSLWGRHVQAVTVMPETGDVLVSFLKDGTVKGDVVQLASPRPKPSEQPETAEEVARPGSLCAFF